MVLWNYQAHIQLIILNFWHLLSLMSRILRKRGGRRQPLLFSSAVFSVSLPSFISYILAGLLNLVHCTWQCSWGWCCQLGKKERLGGECKQMTFVSMACKMWTTFFYLSYLYGLEIKSKDMNVAKWRRKNIVGTVVTDQRACLLLTPAGSKCRNPV